MRLLLDTHCTVWAFMDTKRLSKVARDAIQDPASTVYVSVGSVWEIAIKVGIGKWPQAQAVLLDFEAHMLRANFLMLPIQLSHARAAGLIVATHRDPFDRLLAAQAVAEGLILVTSDPQMPSLGAQVIW